MIDSGTVVGWCSIRNFQQTTIAIIPYLLLTLLFSIISVTVCGNRSRDEYPESEEYSYISKSEENYQKNKDMQKICMQKLPAPISITSVPIEKDVQIPESVITEEIFVPIGKSSRDPLPSKGVMTANRNKITAQTGTPIQEYRQVYDLRRSDTDHVRSVFSMSRNQRNEYAL